MKSHSKKYHQVHYWIHSKYGTASKCENPQCEKLHTKRYEWSLKKGYACESKRDNFWQLCGRCHRKYDFTETTRRKLIKANKGKTLSMEHKTKIKKSLMGHKHSEETKRKISQSVLLELKNRTANLIKDSKG